MAKPRLKKGDVTIREIYQLSWLYYKDWDNKYWRMGLDIKSIYIIKRDNYKYDRSTHTWIQTGRNAKILFKVVSMPVSYQKIDTRKKHSYPVTFLIRDISKGLDSPFRWRTGSLKKPVLAKKGKKYTKKERIEIANTNIKNGVQLDFFFNLEEVLYRYDLLYGVNWTNRKLPIKSKNVDHIPYFDKTALYCVHKILFKMLGSKIIKQKLTS